MNAVEQLHERYIKQRRVRALAGSLASVIPERASILDVGCGDGLLAQALVRRRADVTVLGLEVSTRSDTPIPVKEFDGVNLPFADGAFDVVLFVDVLHHTHHAEQLLREARRVARATVVIKDHCADGILAHATLRFMDRVGNARHGVPLPHLYLKWAEWRELFARLDLPIHSVERRMRLYPKPFSWIFDRSLHFVAVLRRGAAPP